MRGPRREKMLCLGRRWSSVASPVWELDWRKSDVSLLRSARGLREELEGGREL